MKEFEIEFYEKVNGECPIEKFLLNINIKMRAKLLGIMGILKEKGNLLREPYSEHLGDGIYEIRGKVGSDISRVLFFFYYDRKIIFTNGFIKKSQKTPILEIEKAKKYRRDYIERCKRNEKV